MLLPTRLEASLIDSRPPLFKRSGTDDLEEAGRLLPQTESSPERHVNPFKQHHGVFQEALGVVWKFVGLIRGRRNFQVLLCSFFLTALASSDTKLLVQYISKRYEWTFAQVSWTCLKICPRTLITIDQAGFMLSAKAIVNFTLLAIVIPRIIRKSASTRATQDSEVRLNYLGAEVSIVISVIGVLCVAVAFQFWMLLGALVIYALGSALPVFTMSLVKSQLISFGDSDTQDFSIVMLTKTLGSLVGAPLMASLWIQAIRLGGVGLGLPYFVSAVRQFMYAVSRIHANALSDNIHGCCNSYLEVAFLGLEDHYVHPVDHVPNQEYNKY